MTRFQWLLLAAIVLEAGVGAELLRRRLAEPAPPVPDLSAIGNVASQDIRALVRQCHTPERWARLGEVYLATGFFPEAEACLGQAGKMAPTIADYAFKHGFALERLGKVDEANERYQRAVALNHPRPEHCWYYVAKNHLRGERENEAASAFQKAGNLPGARYELAVIEARAGRVDEAEAQAQRLAVEQPDAYPPISLRYRLAIHKRDRSAADALGELFSRRSKPLPTPHDTEIDWLFAIAKQVGQNRLFHEAGKHVQAGELAGAEQKLRKALADGWSPEIADKLAETVFLLGRRKEAAELLAEAVAERPSFELLWRLGQAYEAIGNPTEGLAAWQRAARVATGPAAKGLWEDLADRYERMGDRRARAFHAKAHLAACLEHLEAGNPAAAAKSAKQGLQFEAAQPSPDSSLFAHLWFCLAEAARQSGDPAAARSGYQQCLRLDPDHGRARRGLKLMGE